MTRVRDTPGIAPRFALLHLTQKEINLSNYLLYKMLPSALVVQLKEVSLSHHSIPSIPPSFPALIPCPLW